MRREKGSSLHLDLKKENRNKIFNKIREAVEISAPALSYELQLSRPTVKQNLDELLEEGYIYENGTFGHTGGRRAKAYSVAAKSKVAVGIDLTRHHITVIIIDLCAELIYEKRIRADFSQEDSYYKKLGELTEEAVASVQIKEEAVLGVGITVPGLITEDHQTVFFGKILGFTGLTAAEIGKYIPYPCRMYNDADAAGYAEISKSEDLTDAFYISLSNNVGGSVLINHKVYKGEGARSGEIGHMTIQPGGRACYCGQKGCFEAYCNAGILAGGCDGNLRIFFERLEQGDARCSQLWEEYLHHLAIAVNNVRMLFDCKIIIGGYVGEHFEKYLPSLKRMAAERNTFEEDADYLRVCAVKKEALALGGALPYVHGFLKNI